MFRDGCLPRLDPKNLFDWSKLVFGLVEDQKPPVADVIDPTMEPDGAGSDAGSYGRVGPEVLQLKQDVFFNQRPGHVIARGVGVFRANHPQGGVRVPQPALDRRHRSKRG